MSQRTTTAAVKIVLGDDYNGRSSLQPYIDSASVTVDRLVSMAARKSFTHSSTELEIIERWLSGWYYTKMDRVYTNRSTEGASGGFVNKPSDPEPYKDAAIALDASGCLNALLNRQRAGSYWLGKTVPEQLTYDERNGE